MATFDKSPAKKAKVVGLLFALLNSVIIGLISASAFALVFPGMALWIVVLIGIGAAVAEGFIFVHDVPKAFKIFFGKGLLNIPESIGQHLRNSIVTRELLKNENYSTFSSNDINKLKALEKQKDLRAGYKHLKHILNHPYFISKAFLIEQRNNLACIKTSLDSILTGTKQERDRLAALLKSETNKRNLLFNKDYRKYILIEKEIAQIEIALKAISELEDATDVSQYSLLKKYCLKSQLQSALILFIKHDKRRQLIKHLISAWEAKNNDKDILDLVAINTEQKGKLKREYRIKCVLIGFAVFFALANGIGLGGLTFTSSLTFAAQVGLTATLSPSLLAIAATILAGIAIFAFSMLMYKMLTDAIENNIILQTAKAIMKMFKPPIPWQELSTGQKIWHIINSIFKVLAIIVVIGVSVFIIISTAGTFLQETLEACNTIAAFFIKLNTGIILANKIISDIIVCGSILPLGLMFSLEHCAQGLAKMSAWLNQMATACFFAFLEFIDNPKTILWNGLKTIGGFLTSPSKIIAGLIWLVFFTFFLLHIVGEGAIAAMSSIHPTDRFSKFIQRISQWLHFGPTLFTLILTMVQEMLQDFDYVLPNAQDEASDHQHGLSYNSIQQGLNQYVFPCIAEEGTTDYIPLFEVHPSEQGTTTHLTSVSSQTFSPPQPSIT